MDKKIVQNDPLLTLKNYNGFYQCYVKHGKFVGPLVAYAGTYINDVGKEKNFVGNTYFNIAMVETSEDTRNYYSDLMMWDMINKGVDYPDKVIGMPMGGIKFSQSFGDMINVPSIFAEKKILELADPEKGIKEKSEIIIARHEILPKEKIFIIEDLCNNFSTTTKAVEKIEAFGAKVIGIACVVNRSEITEWNGIPVISAIFKPSPQYKQEDQEVVDLIWEGKVIWKAKHFWQELKRLEQAEKNQS